MKKVVIKPYWNVEKEQKWLNHMAQNGYALVDYFWIRYVFEKTNPGEYAYQIDLLEHKKRSPETEEYLQFLEESDIEVVDTYMRWAYLRKKTSEGPFCLYSDTESKLLYLNRLRRFWMVFVIMEMWFGIINLIPAGMHLFLERDLSAGTVNLIAAIVCIAMGIGLLLGGLYPVLTQIRKVRKEENLFE